MVNPRPALWPLADCIARPDQDGLRFPLVEHLEAVAYGCGGPDGIPEDRLAFLGGLMHDAAKSDYDWQVYIRNPSVIRRGPPHAPLGAALFAFFADDLIPRWSAGDRDLRRRLIDLALDWTRVVYDHHGELRDLSPSDAPWNETFLEDLTEQLPRCDEAGIVALVRRFFPESLGDLERFDPWLSAFDGLWCRRVKVDRGEMLRVVKHAREQEGADVPLDAEGLRLARLATRLIFADRSHAANWAPSHLRPDEAEEAAATLEAHCATRAEEAIQEGANPDLVRARGDVRQSALGAYTHRSDAKVYSLLLPTGYGKTLTGLRIALEACRTGRCRRIIYVAPYLSILSQAAAEIRNSSGMEVFVHHHMTTAELDDGDPYDVLDTWQAPVLATTFNQLFRALFPRRAQQCLRIPALDGAFLFIDEPQIVDVTVWNLFLRTLAVVLEQGGGQALLCTATFPPPGIGLGFEPVPLAPRDNPGISAVDRYRIVARSAPWDIAETAEQARQLFDSRGSVATILNTVRDAVQVYQKIVKEAPGPWYFLAGMMLPGHKAERIQVIKRRLKPGRFRPPKSTGVVCTQVLEAGVDLSFRDILRAFPIFSSVAQSAGRGNRHGEGEELAEIVVFPFVRDNGQDSRPFVYRDETARRHTDGILHDFPEIAEGHLPGALREYYDRCWRENPVTACLGLFEASARGRWSAIAGQGPFGDSVPEVEVFVPDSDRYLIPSLRLVLDRLGVTDGDDLLLAYQDRAFCKSLGFLRRKRLSAMLRQFTVGMPKKLAERIAHPTPEHDWPWVLDDPASYSEATGLAHCVNPSDDDVSCLLV